MIRILLAALCWSMVVTSWGQTKKKIDTEAYYRWSTISGEKISNSGKWVTYIQKAYRGNDDLHLIENQKPVKKWERVKKYHADPIEEFMVIQQTIDNDSIRQLKIKKVKKKKWPADSLSVFISEKDTSYWFKEVASFETGEEGPLVLVSHDERFELPKEEVKEKKKCFISRMFGDKEPAKLEGKSELEGSVLTVFDVSTKTMKDFENIKESSVNKHGNSYAYIQDALEDTSNLDRLFAGKFNEEKEVFSVVGEISNLTWSEDGSYLAFNVSVDTTEAKKQQLYLYQLGGEAEKVLDTASQYFKKYQCVAGKPMVFSRDGSKLYFQVGIKPKDDPKDTVPDDEKAKLDVWSWTDGEIQPQQLKNLKKDKPGLVDYVYHLSDKKVVQLQDTSMQSMKYYLDRNSEYALLTDQSPYLKEMTWDYWYYDVYRVDINTGEKNKLGEHVFGWNYSLSPRGKYYTEWSPQDSSWYLIDIALGKKRNLTKSLPDQFYMRNHDVPSKIEAEGSVYWLKDEMACAIEGQNEFWIIPIEGKPYKFTKGLENNESYRFLSLDEDEHYIDLVKGFYLQSFNHKTKAAGIYFYGMEGLEKLGEWDAAILKVEQSKNKEKLLLEKMSFTESYNLFIGNGKLGKLQQITDVNPQQEDYKWGTVELFDWKDYKGNDVQGLLYKPEDFDPSKSYPMIVYFYELYTDDIHRYYRPKPTASIIYPTEYVSNDYIVFIPDIRYEIGHPAEGAYNAIMSGTDAILKAYPNIDSTRMGLQGQSWGGYQTAQMVTMTTRYKCAMAGAPVSNMFSAYGGVRWGSGLSRTFQYETGQSRIGATIWEAPELYTENSPLFHLPKVETPLLIMHNDGDGAVPWYQGIELYQGLRRLQKPVWMLNYNDDEHNLMKDANRMDLSIRMREFFDHYLLGEPAPNWLINGVPAVKKGEE